MFNKQKTLRIAIILALSAITFGCSTSAERHMKKKQKAVADVIVNTSPADRASAWTQGMTQTLGLSPKQQQQVGGINLDIASRFNILAASKNPALNKRTEAASLMMQQDAMLRKVLNERQITTWEANRAELLDVYRTL